MPPHDRPATIASRSSFISDSIGDHVLDPKVTGPAMAVGSGGTGIHRHMQHRRVA